MEDYRGLHSSLESEYDSDQISTTRSSRGEDENLEPERSVLIRDDDDKY
jgi:hypothetical protein